MPIEGNVQVSPYSPATVFPGNSLRTLAVPEPIKGRSLTSLNEKLIKFGAKVISHGRYVAFQTAAVPRHMCAD
jgi:hypothetical protein